PKSSEIKAVNPFFIFVSLRLRVRKKANLGVALIVGERRWWRFLGSHEDTMPRRAKEGLFFKKVNQKTCEWPCEKETRANPKALK
ncbi:MAG: hypothetical protein KDC71_12560, partial [Acidobacteria bacterium]|nr:hypothetical protein [Acidobacteriota bacterium]